MAEFYTLIERAVGRLQPNTESARRDVYARARSAVVQELRAVNPPLAPAELSRREHELEEAIRKVEREYGVAGRAPGDAVVPMTANAADLADDDRAGTAERREPAWTEPEFERPPRRSMSSRLLLVALLALVLGGVVYAAYTYRSELQDLYASLIGEGDPTESSVATADAGAGADIEAPAAVEVAAAIPTQSFLYEEVGTGDAPANAGTVDWVLIEDADETRIEVRIDIPARGVQLVLGIRKAPDGATNASHMIDIAVTVPPEHAGGAVESIAPLAAKTSEDAIGTAMVAQSVLLSPGHFMLELAAEDERHNLLQMRRDWFDLGLVYANGDRALVTFNKGSQGYEVMQLALAAWQD
ncbi:MAG: hypothetical protein KIT43_01160 [Bauldia sp.]|nr:hypothetical protein [Bauldia sp.]